MAQTILLVLFYVIFWLVESLQILLVTSHSLLLVVSASYESQLKAFMYEIDVDAQCSQFRLKTGE